MARNVPEGHRWIYKNGHPILIKADKTDIEDSRIKKFVKNNVDAAKLYSHMQAQYNNGKKYGTDTVYKLETQDGNIALIRNTGGTITGLISTGGGAGKEALAQSIETSISKSVNLDADTPNARSYYNHLGLTPYKGYSINPDIDHYVIPQDAYKSAVDNIRNRRKK